MIKIKMTVNIKQKKKTGAREEEQRGKNVDEQDAF